MTKKKIGILLFNLGTPSEATEEAIGQYLSEFLMDRHVVDLPKWFWSPLLHRVIIPKRAKKISHHYQSIWQNGLSPLRYYSERLLDKLNDLRDDWVFSLGMTYGAPSLKEAIDELNECHSIYVLPLFPQYSTTTTLAGLNQLDKLIDNASSKSIKQFHFLTDYAEEPDYITALHHHISDYLSSNNTIDTLLLSYHGIPLSYVKKRKESYLSRCEITTQRLAECFSISHPDLKIKMSYQSKFGKGQWAEPNTTNLLSELASQKNNVAVLCPGFSMDCIETLYEIDVENRAIFEQAGGQVFHYIPALNDSLHQVNLIKNLVDKMTMERDS